jgi:hypothetical protein
LLKGALFVHLDPRIGGVRAPEWLMKQPQLVLQVGLDMPVQIPDLRVDDDGIYGTLSFNRTPFTCFVPWDAVFALVGDDGRGLVWPDSFPFEIAQEVQREAARAGIEVSADEVLESPKPRRAARRPRASKLEAKDEASHEPPSGNEPPVRGLQLIEGGGQAGGSRSKLDKPPPKSRHLRLVKR